MEQLAILRNPRLSVDDRDYVALRFDASTEGTSALQMICLEGPDEDVARFNELIRAAGNFNKLNGLPIIVKRDGGFMLYKRPANA